MNGSFMSGWTKGFCYLRQVLVELGNKGWHRCTHSGVPDSATQPHNVVQVGSGNRHGGDDQRQDLGDWASARIKYTCPHEYYVAVISLTAKVAGVTWPGPILCIKAGAGSGAFNVADSGKCHTVWVDRGSGTCNANEFVKGIAMGYQNDVEGHFAAMLCCPHPSVKDKKDMEY
jgi:hypothetical protein